ncbi:hypothetical protein ABI59_15145 [Acidobacteria bacterium Mor1]|nr:hypothetical protein ABI59_15145 [Acidobacteria bacterium Mor1]
MSDQTGAAAQARSRTSLNLSLPPKLRQWVDAQVQSGRYGNASEYIRDLIRQDQRREAERILEELLIQGLEPTGSHWDDERPDFQQIAKLLQEKKQQRSP